MPSWNDKSAFFAKKCLLSNKEIALKLDFPLCYVNCRKESLKNDIDKTENGISCGSIYACGGVHYFIDWGF